MQSVPIKAGIRLIPKRLSAAYGSLALQKRCNISKKRRHGQKIAQKKPSAPGECTFPVEGREREGGSVLPVGGDVIINFLDADDADDADFS